MYCLTIPESNKENSNLDNSSRNKGVGKTPKLEPSITPATATKVIIFVESKNIG